MTSCNALVYEAIQRVYRNAVVDRIRAGMQAAYPGDYESRVTSPFPTWDDIVSAAAKSAVTGVVAHPHQDVFDYLDVSHFPVLLNNYFSVLAPVEGVPPEQIDQLKRSCWRTPGRSRQSEIPSHIQGPATSASPTRSARSTTQAGHSVCWACRRQPKRSSRSSERSQRRRQHPIPRAGPKMR